MPTQLKKFIDNLEQGNHPTFLDVMEAISQVTETVTLDERPAANAELITICELNGRVCCE